MEDMFVLYDSVSLGPTVVMFLMQLKEMLSVGERKLSPFMIHLQIEPAHSLTAENRISAEGKSKA